MQSNVTGGQGMLTAYLIYSACVIALATYGAIRY